MTYKELLNLVTFKEVEPHIVNMYPEAKDSLGWFKLHYDMLRLMNPKRHDLTSSSCHPKIFIKEFCYFLMPCHQHSLRINLLVQR